MIFRRLFHLSLGFFLISGGLAAEPTELRIWTSSGGTKVKAKATELTPNGTVTLETPDGRKLTLGIDEFTKSDQSFIEKHFRTEGEAKGPPADSGILKGPLEADADTSYYVYLPKNFDEKLRSPVMIWTQSDGAKAETLTRFSEAADVLGMIIATPVEARNEGQVTLLNNLVHSNDVLRALKKDYSINSKAIHYGGNDTGAAAALWNSAKNRSAGTFTVSGFLTEEMTATNEGHHFMAGGTTSANRYLTAWSAAKFGDEGTHYLYQGGREMPSERDIAIGMTWMYAQSLYENLAARTDEARSFQKRILPWLKELAETSEGEAAYLTEMLTENCSLRGSFKQEVEKLDASLERKASATAYVGGREALDKFSEDELAKYGNHYAPLKEHAPKKFERMTERLAEKYQGSQELQPVIKELAKPTHR